MRSVSSTELETIAKDDLFKVDTSTLDISGFPKIGRPLLSVTQKQKDNLVLAMDPIFYNLETEDRREYVITPERLANLLGVTINKRRVKAYWGVESSGDDAHIGHVVPLTQLASLRQLYGDKIEFWILIADIHYEKGKCISSYGKEHETTVYNTEALREKFKRLMPFAHVVVGSEYQSKEDYVRDVREMKKYVTIQEAKRAVAQLVRVQSDDEFVLSHLDYPVDQAVDIKYVADGEPVDMAVAGIDQRHTYMLSEKRLKHIRCNPPAFVHSPMISSLAGPESGKMSKSDGKIKAFSVLWLSDPLEDKDGKMGLYTKCQMAWCPPKTIERNPIMELFRYYVFTFEPYATQGIYIKESKEFGGKEVRVNWYEFVRGYEKGRFIPQIVKEALPEYLWSINRVLRV
jgi:tyrosyl-tRNA synthetase